MAAENDNQPRIVAGVDGSPSSLRALRWAIRQADLTGAVVDAVIAWHYPELAATGGYGMSLAYIAPRYEFSDYAEKVIAEAISTALSPGSDVRVRGREVEGHSAGGAAWRLGRR